jgi:alpha-L-fucosidase 2
MMRNLLAFVALCLFASLAGADVRLPPILANGMVLQRESNVGIFGFASPGEHVDVSGSWGARAEGVIADGTGYWVTRLRTPAAGGPFTLEVRGKNLIKLEDVLVGEVWLGSGQSNMEMPVGFESDGYSGVADWQNEVARAGDAELRFFTTDNALASSPRTDCGGAWKACTSETTKHFSATGYFFARELRRELGVPIGVIASDWGGTPAESWMSSTALQAFPEFAERVAQMSEEGASLESLSRAHAREMKAWRALVAEVDPGTRAHFESASFDDSKWRTIPVPGAWQGDLATHDGFVWLRRRLELPASHVDRELALELGAIDDNDTTWFDGVQVGETLEDGNWATARSYRVPKELATPGSHVIAVRVLDTGGFGGMTGKAGDLRLRVADGLASVVLDGDWRALRGAALATFGRPPSAQKLDPWTPSALYNAMIAPLVRYGIRGVIWYQGESNRERADEYRDLFPALIADWRARFRNAEMPFLFVQIAPFAYAGDRGEAGELREAQRLALALPHTGMAVTADIGLERDIHPKNKQEVGRRLALLALAKAYGRDVEFSGPTVRDVLHATLPSGKPALTVTFDHAQGLRLDAQSPTKFQIAGKDLKFAAADATCGGNAIVLWNDSVPEPAFVRYAQGAIDRAALFNAAGLPAAPFRTDDAPWITARPRHEKRWSRAGDVLSLSAPITTWDEAVPIGNGQVGALVWGGGKHVHVSIDRGDLWDLRRPDVTKRADWTWATIQRLVAEKNAAKIHELFDAPYDEIAYPTKLPAGRIEIDVDAASDIARFELDLARGEAHAAAADWHIDVLADALRPVFSLRAVGAPTARPRYVVPKIEGYPLTVVSSTEDDYSASTLVSAPDGSLYAVVLAWSATPAATEIAVAITTGAESSDPSALARKLATEALARGYETKRGESDAARQLVHGGASVLLPDAALQTHYDFVHHLLMSGSQRGSPPMPLQGVWTRDGGLPPWKGDYHNDLNTQATYTSYVTAGMYDAGLAFLDFNWSLRARYREFARDFYGVEGLVVPGVMSIDGAPLGGWCQYSLSPTNGAWIAEIFACHARVTGDLEFLRDRAYPWCADLGTALAALAPPDAQGKRRLPLSSSPEIHDNSMQAWLAPNSNYDLAMLRSLFSNLASMARTLGIANDVARWNAVLAGLEDFDVQGERGALTFARGEPFTASHRHFSHAIAIHPLGLLTIEGSERERAIVDATLDQIEEKGTSAWCGYSFAWFACMLARAGRAESALHFLETYERAFTLRNGFHANGDQSGEGLSSFTYRPFTLEGNMLAMEAVHEMLLQSWGGIVRVFPATSVRWETVSFTALRAEGGFLVSADRRGGRTMRVRVLAANPGELRLRDPFLGAVPQWNRTDVRREGRDWIVKLGAREELVGELEVPPPAPPEGPKR